MRRTMAADTRGQPDPLTAGFIETLAVNAVW
jgi:hypothetical protein